MTRLAAVVVSIGAVLGSILGAASTDSAEEACFRAKINAERSARNIPTLANSEPLNIIASTHSEEMAAAGTIYHNENLPNEEGVRPFAAVGENVGMGSSCQIIHDAFMASPGHKANILDRAYNELGVGVEERDGTLFVTEIFRDPAPTPAKKPPAVKPDPKCTCLG